MSGVETAYDITWPHWTSGGDQGDSIAFVADEFSEAIGRKVNWSANYHGGKRESDAYVVEPDGSLEPDEYGDSGLEFVSPPLPIDDMISDLNKVRAWAKQKGCYTNDSTGLHINVSVPGFDNDKLDYVKLALLLGDQYVLDQFGRTGNTYAKSAMGMIKERIAQRPEDAAAMLQKMKTGLGELATKVIHSGTTSKYTSINTKEGYIEFRSPGGDWLNENFDKIETTLLRFVVALDAAMDPAKYRDEYLKKLYAVLKPKDQNDTLSYFAKFAAGELPKAALKSFIKQAQLERKDKKNTGNSAYTAIPSSGNQKYQIQRIANDEIVGTFNAASDTDANAVARQWMADNGLQRVDFRLNRATGQERAELNTAAPTPVPGIIDIETDVEQNFVPGSTLDLQRQRQQAAQQSAASGTFTGTWAIKDSQGNTLHTFSGIGNSQADANRVAAGWLARAGYQDGLEVAVVPVLSEGQDRYGNFDPPGPESPPKMPAGTIKVDVSDMYDWYKLGQHISDLSSVDKNTLGKGPPETVFAFGSEELENMYSHELGKLGLKTHDLDEPGEEDVDEQIVTELKINNTTGVGAVPYNQSIDYHGLRVTMQPSMFLRLALPLDRNDPEERKAIEYCKSQLDDQGIGAPFLTITVPEAWESDDFSLEAKVRDHDGRHRCYAILDKEGDEPIEVHLMLSGGLRRRDISDLIIKNLRNGILNQQGQYVRGPIFDTAQ